MWHRRVEKDPDAEKAVREAKENLKRVKARDPEVQRVARESKMFRQQNHFADQLGPLFSPPSPRKERP